MARLYTDENFPLQVADELRKLGHEVLTAQAASKALQALSDVEVLGFAIAESRAVVTLNRKHFLRLHLEMPEHTGIVVCTFDPDFLGQARRIHAAVEKEKSLAGKLVRVNRPGPGEQAS